MLLLGIRPESVYSYTEYRYAYKSITSEIIIFTMTVNTHQWVQIGYVIKNKTHNFTAEFRFPSMSISAIKYRNDFTNNSSTLWMKRKASVSQMPQENINSIITNARYSL